MKKKKLTILKNKIKYHNYCYHTLNSQKISNLKYDKMIQKLEKIEKKNPNLITKNSPSQTVGSKPLKIFQSVIHKKPMLSLNNVFNTHDYLKFDKKIRKIIKNQKKIEFCCEPKLDGLAISLIYKNKKLSQASTRGDGKIGENVTKNAKFIKDIPKILKGNDIPKYIEIRGEVFMRHKQFYTFNKKLQSKGKKIFSNTRNAAVGSLRQINPEITKKRSLSFFCYGFGKISDGNLPSNHYSCLKKFKEWGIPISDHITICQNNSEILNFYKKIKKKHLNFDIDGIVIKVNSLKNQKKIGSTTKAPKWAIAFKFPDKLKTTKINNISFQVGRTGIITPIAHLNPIQISGVTIKNSTLHNINEIKRLKINIGDTVLICRSGGVIPKIIKNIKKNKKKNKTITFPNKCPVCKSQIQKIKKTGLIYCTNVFFCSAQITRKIQHFVSKKAMNIKGIGKKIIKQLFDEKIIQNPFDIYNLNYNSLIKLNGFQIKKTKNLIQSIEKSKNVTLSRFIYSLGIPEIGEVTSNLLAKKYTSIKNLTKANFKSLKQINNIGETIAKKIIFFFKNKKNKKIIYKLQKKINIYENKQKIKKNILLKNKKIVLTGKIKKISRKNLQEILILNGAKIMSNVSKNTDLIIAGKNPGSKFFKAIKLKIKIIQEEKLKKILKY